MTTNKKIINTYYFHIVIVFFLLKLTLVLLLLSLLPCEDLEPRLDVAMTAFADTFVALISLSRLTPVRPPLATANVVVVDVANGVACIMDML